MPTRIVALALDGRKAAPRASVALDVLRLVETWVERAHQRRALRRLPEYVLRDMALSDADIAAEANKPFWQP